MSKIIRCDSYLFTEVAGAYLISSIDKTIFVHQTSLLCGQCSGIVAVKCIVGIVSQSGELSDACQESMPNFPSIIRYLSIPLFRASALLASNSSSNENEAILFSNAKSGMRPLSTVAAT
jgi:hypothetical protein